VTNRWINDPATLVPSQFEDQWNLDRNLINRAIGDAGVLARDDFWMRLG